MQTTGRCRHDIFQRHGLVGFDTVAGRTIGCAVCKSKLQHIRHEFDSTLLEGYHLLVVVVVSLVIGPHFAFLPDDGAYTTNSRYYFGRTWFDCHIVIDSSL